MDLQMLQDTETVADVCDQFVALYEAIQLVCNESTILAIDKAYEAILDEE